jgi:hypothetical protein
VLGPWGHGMAVLSRYIVTIPLSSDVRREGALDFVAVKLRRRLTEDDEVGIVGEGSTVWCRASPPARPARCRTGQAQCGLGKQPFDNLEPDRILNCSGC